MSLQNPLDQYPRPPFEADDSGDEPVMSPKPDHGEETYRGNGRLKGRKAFVTGGNSGLGRATALAFAREGADVVFTFHSDEEGAAEALAEIEKSGVTAASLKVDISDEKECTDAIATAAEKLGGLDTLVMVAGYQNNVPDILDLETDQLDLTFRTNVYSLYWLTKAALEHLPEGGSIITTSSVQANQPSADKLDYAATKGAIVTFTKALAQQLAPRGIRVNAVLPGPFWTNLQPDSASGADDLSGFGSDTPYGRPGQPAEIAGAYVYFASADASYTSGATLVVSGGSPN
ncbi:SDR family oxidoreductase [Mycetocola manganoxydans]|uniref:SDR family oxidoreductase n=1 Tax=Mycetocola manganoxydans TaxID=699879 RepID=A0A3L7A062_9MICO|nr:SDR family oxidoreductase [Mycetocola manganoxydans]RLP73517.1 SDR family oxidoreductase [Mycetocola manganoxydans]GHD41328.1 NAD(P)-dependent oxidoreductase [Mycetocola manganoxydans]